MKATIAAPRSARPRLTLTVATFAAAIDGLDGQAVAFVAPGLARQWGIPLPAFGAIFALGLTGLIVGGVLLAPLGDRFGRNRLIAGAGLGVALFTFATAFSTSVPQLVAARFLTGMCLGAMMPGLISLAHELAPEHQRAVYVTVLMSGFPLGGFGGGVLAAWLLPRFGWQAMFMGTGLIAAGVVVVLVGLLAPGGAPAPRAAVRPALPVTALFSEGRFAMTLVIWLLFFATLLNIYLLASWLPALLERAGFTGPQAAVAAGIANLGGAAGGLGIGFLVARHGERVLAAAFIIGAAGMVALGMINGGDLAPMLAIAFITGAMIPGGHVANNAIAAAHYPRAVRTTGIGWAQSVGRVGSVLGPALVGLALAAELSNREIFVLAATLSLVSAAAAAMLHRLKLG